MREKVGHRLEETARCCSLKLSRHTKSLTLPARTHPALSPGTIAPCKASLHTSISICPSLILSALIHLVVFLSAQPLSLSPCCMGAFIFSIPNPVPLTCSLEAAVMTGGGRSIFLNFLSHSSLAASLGFNGSYFCGSSCV